ncbi:MAG TPA: NYN domain-containing protein, partial [Actinomycetes bacterium]|nr:NYN domain-containing protein [Actinomycetes bacterium]
MIDPGQLPAQPRPQPEEAPVAPVPRPEAVPDGGPDQQPDAPPAVVVLPEPVRQRVVALAADALGALPIDEVPSSLRQFARFAPQRRRLAATPIAAALESDAAFRSRVADRVRTGLPDVAAGLDAGVTPAAADPLDVAAVAYLLRPPGWDRHVEAAVAELAEADSTARSARTEQAATRLQEQLAAAKSAARTDLTRLRGELDKAKAEISELRYKLRDARERARTAEIAANQAQTALAAAVAEAEASRSGAETDVRRMRAKLTETETSLEAMRRAAREGRAAEDVRLRLLLDTVLDAAQGLRRELALPPATIRPADTAGAIVPDAVDIGAIGGRALDAADPAVLDQLLALPQVHLIVDGYNVTKTGYGELTLEDQRARLAAGLGAVAARTQAEITCVFDGAALTAPVVLAAPRGVRVLFSQPGETADELIRRLVRLEPAGRPVVVVSSD